MLQDPEYLTYAEAAELIKVKPQTLRSLVCKESIPHYRISGRMVRFEKQEVIGWMRTRRKGPAK